jgi:hypothetical protein
MSDDHMLAIGAPKWSLIATFFETLHPDGDAIGIPVKDLDAVAAAV